MTNRLLDLEHEIKELQAEYAACDDFVSARHEIKEKLDAAKAEHFDEMKKLKPRDIYDRVCSGDPVSDGEISVGIQHFRELSDLLLVSGPVFKLASNEANRIYLRLTDFQKARKER